MVALLFIAASTPALCQPISPQRENEPSEQSALSESNDRGQRQEENEPKREAKNATASLVNEFEALQVTVGAAWKDMEEVAAEVRPQIMRLSLKAGHLKEVLKDSRRLSVPSAAAVCEELNSCTKCATSSICGWCGESMKCVPGSHNGPADSCPAAQFSYESCPGMGCKSLTSCDLCTQDAMCGWCSSSAMCIDGTEWGPSRAALSLPFLAAKVPCTVASNTRQNAMQGDQVAASAGAKCGLGGTLGWVHRDSQTSQTCPMPVI